MRRIEYQDLSTELKTLIQKMEKDLNKEESQGKPFVSRLQVLLKDPLQSDSSNTEDIKLECDVAVFQLDKSKGEYVFSHIENKDPEE